MKRQLHFLGQQLNKIQKSLGELWLVPSSTPKSTRQKLVVKQRNLWPSYMQGQSINTPLDLSTHLTDFSRVIMKQKLQRLNSVLTQGYL